MTALIIRTRRWALLLSVGLLLLVASDLVHTIGIAATALGGLGAKFLAYLRASSYSFLGWIFAVIALRNLRRPRAAGFLAAGLSGFCAFLLTGLADFATLYRSQAPFVWGIWLDRLTISIALGVGLGVMVTSFVIGRRFVDLDDDHDGLLEPGDLDDTERWPQLRLLSPHRPPETMTRPSARCRSRRLTRTGAAALLASLLAAACGGHSAQTFAANPPGATVVVLRDVAFNPAVVTVKVGTTVDWKWEDHGIIHNVVSVGAGPLHSNLQATGDYDYRFTTPGTYRYHCSVHLYMYGTVIVQGN